MHYNPRFDERVVVRNTNQMEQWGTEERSGGLPFQEGQPFQVGRLTFMNIYCFIDAVIVLKIILIILCVLQVTISCNPHHYNVFVNGNQAHTYKHRYTQLNSIDILEISGDLQLTLVQA